MITEPRTAKRVGFVLSFAGAALTLYSIPFVTWVAFSFFILGVVIVGLGIRLLLATKKTTR